MARLSAGRRRIVKNYPYTLNFPGSNGNHLSIGTDVYLFERTQAWSISFGILVKKYNTGSGGHIFSEYQSTVPYRGRLIRIDTGLLHFWLINTFGSNELKVSYSPPPVGRFVRVVITYDGSGTAAGVKCYYNNILQAQISTIATLSATIVATGVSTRWGAWSGDGVNQPMYLSRPSIHNYELTAQQVADDWYDANWNGTAPIDLYELSEGSGTSVASIGSAAHNGTIAGTVTWESTIVPMKSRTVISQNRLGLS